MIYLRLGHAPDPAPRAPAPKADVQASQAQAEKAQAENAQAPAPAATSSVPDDPASGLAALETILQCLGLCNRPHVFESEPAGGGDGLPKAKAKAKAGGKKKNTENPKAVFDVRKAKVSGLSGAFPLVDRAATKELLGQVMLQKATWLNHMNHMVKFAGPCSDILSSLIDSEYASARQGKWRRLPFSCKGTRLLRKPWTICSRQRPRWMGNGLQLDGIVHDLRLGFA